MQINVKQKSIYNSTLKSNRKSSWTSKRPIARPDQHYKKINVVLAFLIFQRDLISSNMNEAFGRIISPCTSVTDSSRDREECGFRMNPRPVQPSVEQVVQPNLGFRHVPSLAFPFANNVTNLWPWLVSLESATSCATTRPTASSPVKLIWNRGSSASYRGPEVTLRPDQYSKVGQTDRFLRQIRQTFR